jgi:tetratricopeptide (TPR) repeat protein
MALRGAGDPERAVALLSAVQQRHPGDVWVNYELAQALRAQKPPQLPEAIRYYTAAQALRPEVGHALGHALEEAGRPGEAIAVFRQLTQLRPLNVRHHKCLGNVLFDRGRLEEAEAEYRKAIHLDPKLAQPHHNLGNALYQQGRLEDAEVEYGKAIHLDSKLALPHFGLGNVLFDRGWLEEAEAEYRKAIHLDPKLAQPHHNLGNVLRQQGRLEDAEAEYGKAIHLDPKAAQPHYGLGNILGEQGRLEEARAEYQKAIHLDPKFAQPHHALGYVLLQQGRLAEARAEFRQAVVLGLKAATASMQQCDRLLTLTKRLPAVLRSEDRPTSVDERLEFALLCQKPFEQRYAAASRFYADAFAADPKLADDLKSRNRYKAACAAALAAAGQGKDAAKLDDKEKARLRGQALGWLQADLALWTKPAQSTKPQDRAAVQQTLRHWQQDTDLASVRDAASLAKLPQAEREAWQELWAEVATLADAAQQKKPKKQ